jgi:hypothetical protein
MIKKENSVFFSKVLPIIILLIWVVCIGVMEWQHVCASPQPPIYDAISYIQKAKSFWDNVAQGWAHNPFDLVQSLRPPGTVLLSYPFGFSVDYRGFLFRSVFVPFIIWIIAILIASWPLRSKIRPVTFWPSILGVFLLGPMPFFFQFEYPTDAYWGLVDGFLASLAALAVACAGRSLIKKSRTWVVLAVLVATFCTIIKPSGSIVLLLTALFWCGATLLSIILKDGLERREKFNFWLFGTIVFVLIGGVTSWLLLQTSYLSQEVQTYMKQAVKILQAETGSALTFPVFVSMLNFLFGPQLFIIVILGGFFNWKKTGNNNFQPPSWLFLSSSFLFLLIGGYFWLVLTGISSIRYFYPFALMILIPIIIITFRKIYSLYYSLNTYPAWGIGLVSVIPSINLICLLVFQNPNNDWQKFAGVSMKIGSGGAGTQIAKKFLKELKISNQSAEVYCISNTIECYSFNSYGLYQNIINPTAVHFTSVLPIDWQRPSTYRIPEILSSDYILFQPVSGSYQKEVLNLKKINSIREEQLVFEAFLSSLKTENGLQTMFENEFCRLSKITDKSSLREAFTLFVKSKSWRSTFVEENEKASAIESASDPLSITLRAPTCKINSYIDTIILTDNNLSLWGWGFLEGMNSDSLKTYILLKKNDTISVFSVNVTIRKDVTDYFNSTGLNLDSTGFNVKIPAEKIEKGHYNLGLYIVRGNQLGMMYSDKYIDIGK